MAGKKNLDDRQIKFLGYYLDPKSSTYSNAYQSAIKAKYAKQYAEVITNLGTKWLSEAIRKREVMLVKAEKNLDEFLEMSTVNEGLDKLKNKISYDDPKLKRIKADVSVFVAETLGKKHYSKRSPLEDDEGKNVLAPLAQSLKSLADKK